MTQIMIFKCKQTMTQIMKYKKIVNRYLNVNKQ